MVRAKLVELPEVELPRTPTEEAAMNPTSDETRNPQKTGRINLSQDVEEEWEDVMVRLRHHIAGRAKRSESAKINEGREILDPLLNAVKKMRADAEARATLRAKKANDVAE